MSAKWARTAGPIGISRTVTPSAFISPWALSRVRDDGAEAGHRDRDDAAVIAPDGVERLHGHEQRERAVEATRDADHDVAGARVQQAPGEAGRLDGEDLFAVVAAPSVIVRYERKAIDGPSQIDRIPG